MLRPPWFPVGIDDLPGTVHFHDHGDDSFSIGEIDVTTRLIPHIGNTLGFRVEYNGMAVAYVSDHQQPGVGATTVAESVVELCRDADLVIHDAQYTDAEFARKSTWGHCTIGYAVHTAATCGARRVALFHHDPGHDDAMLSAIEAHYRENPAGVEVIVAREQMVLSVGE